MNHRLKHESYRCLSEVQFGESDEMEPSPAAPFASHSACFTGEAKGAPDLVEEDAKTDDVLAAFASCSLLFDENSMARIE